MLGESAAVGELADANRVRVTSVVVDWNGGALTQACLASLDGLRVPPGTTHDVLVVDNGSAAGASDALRAAHPNIAIARLPANTGFAGGANHGLRRAFDAGAAWVLLLNNDVEVDPELLARLLDGARDPRVGMATPTIRVHGSDAVWPSAGTRRWATLAARDTTADPPTTAPYAVEWANACCVLIRRAMLEAIGGFDARFAVYYEDHDLCLRARAHGWRIVHVPAARAAHHVAGSTGEGSPRQRYLKARSSVYYFAKHATGVRRAWIGPYRAASTARSVVGALRHGHVAKAAATLRGVADGLVDLARHGVEPRTALAAPPRALADDGAAAGGTSGPRRTAGKRAARRDVAAASPEPGPHASDGERDLPRSAREVEAWLRGVEVVEDAIDGQMLIAARVDLEKYAWLHGRSAQLSLAMLARHVTMPTDRPLRVLELGAAPYFFSALVHRAFGTELTAVSVEAGSWPGEPVRRPRGTVRVALPAERGGRAAELAIDVRVFNIEKDPFPLPDDHYDVVLCMEVLEHLGYSPSHMLAESHRVLVPGGLMFITVPNFINLKRTVNMLLNVPTEFPYSGYGIYGRHQREFAPREVSALLEACHYRVAELATANVWPTFRDDWLKGVGNAALNALLRLPLPWLAAKREYILCAARAEGTPVVGYPAWLYEHRHMYPAPPNGIPAVFD